VAPDDPEALAEGLWQLWQDGALRARLGHRGAGGVRQHYSIARSAERMQQVYEEALRAGTPGTAADTQAPPTAGPSDGPAASAQSASGAVASAASPPLFRTAGRQS
jgi:hypothetical protein